MFHSQETYNSREMCAVVRSTDWSDVVIEISNLQLQSSPAHTQQEKGQVRLETHLLDIQPELVGDLSGRVEIGKFAWIESWEIPNTE